MKSQVYVKDGIIYHHENGINTPFEDQIHAQVITLYKHNTIPKEGFLPMELEIELLRKNYHGLLSCCKVDSNCSCGQTVARIVEEPVKLPFKEFKIKAGSIKIEKWNPVVDIQQEEPVENIDPEIAKVIKTRFREMASTGKVNSQVEDQGELHSSLRKLISKSLAQNGWEPDDLVGELLAEFKITRKL